MTTARTGITAAGTWIVDYAKVISRFPEEGSCVSVLSEAISNGGAPYNLLVNLCRLGATFPLKAVGCLGHDIDGASIMKDCRAHGIITAGMRTIPWASTSFSDVMTTRETGIRTSFNHAGANDLLSAEDFDFEEETSRIFFLGSLFFLAKLDAPDDRFGTLAASVLARARKAGILTCVDIERSNVPMEVFRESSQMALRQTDLIILNVEVAEQLSGVRVRYPSGIDLVAAADAAHGLQTLANSHAVVLRFPTGAFVLSRSGEHVTEGSANLPKSRIVSAIGAGHAFSAGFLYGYHEGWNLSACLKAGHATAAACLSDQTASGGIRTMPSCLKRLASFGQRPLESHHLDRPSRSESKPAVIP